MSSLNGGGESNFPNIGGDDTNDLTVNNLTVNNNILIGPIGIGNTQLSTLQGINSNIQSQINALDNTVKNGINNNGITFYLKASATTVSGTDNSGILQTIPDANVEQTTTYTYPASPNVNTAVLAGAYTTDLSGYTSIPAGLWTMRPFMSCNQSGVRGYYYLNTYIVNGATTTTLYDGSNNQILFNIVGNGIINCPEYQFYCPATSIVSGDKLKLELYWIYPAGTTNSHVNRLFTQVNSYSSLTTPIVNVAPTGPTGPQGQQGPAGTNGTNGANGATGATGATGAQGPKGDKGDTGPPPDMSNYPTNATMATAISVSAAATLAAANAYTDTAVGTVAANLATLDTTVTGLEGDVTTLQSQTQNQTAVPSSTTFSGAVNCDSLDTDNIILSTELSGTGKLNLISTTGAQLIQCPSITLQSSTGLGAVYLGGLTDTVYINNFPLSYYFAQQW